jgi:hypothetical protein
MAKRDSDIRCTHKNINTFNRVTSNRQRHSTPSQTLYRSTQVPPPALPCSPERASAKHHRGTYISPISNWEMKSVSILICRFAERRLRKTDIRSAMELAGRMCVTQVACELRGDLEWVSILLAKTIVEGSYRSAPCSFTCIFLRCS